jgi:hypothetical protein
VASKTLSKSKLRRIFVVHRCEESVFEAVAEPSGNFIVQKSMDEKVIWVSDLCINCELDDVGTNFRLSIDDLDSEPLSSMEIDFIIENMHTTFRSVFNSHFLTQKQCDIKQFKSLVNLVNGLQ